MARAHGRTLPASRRSLQAPRAAALALLGLCLAACPGRLDRPERFLVDAGAADAGSTDAGLEEDAPSLLRRRCATAGCHPADRPQARLDLESPGLATRLRTATSSTSVCRDERLLVPGDPAASLLYDKLGAMPRCGARMPITPGPLEPAEIARVEAWIRAL